MGALHPSTATGANAQYLLHTASKAAKADYAHSIHSEVAELIGDDAEIYVDYVDMAQSKIDELAELVPIVREFNQQIGEIEDAECAFTEENKGVARILRTRFAEIAQTFFAECAGGKQC